MPIISDYARRKKIEYFVNDIPKDAYVLEVGSGEGWLGEVFRSGGWSNYVGLDVVPPADFVGDVRDWRSLGLEPESFDFILAFEVVEHVDCFRALYDLLKPGGRLMLTTPVPHFDWLCRTFEAVGLNQKRTSAHTNLVYLKDVPLFEPVELRNVGLMAQWGKFTKSV